MNAIETTLADSGITLRQAERPTPTPGPEELLIVVHAAGVTPPELGWYPTTHRKDGSPRANAIPGHEFSGTVAAVGAAVTTVTPGEAVFGMNDWFGEGASAEFCLARATDVARKPPSLSHVEAATTPISALTAWQGLLLHGRLQAGQRVLIHGGSGSVGLFAVQLASRHQARVITTGSAAAAPLLQELGAEQAIDYRTAHLQDLAPDFDLIFDTVGGETRDRSWALLRSGGRLVTIASDAELSTDPRVKPAFFIVEPDSAQLTEIAGLLENGTLRTFVKAVLPLAAAAEAYGSAGSTSIRPGKIVLEVRPAAPATA